MAKRHQSMDQPYAKGGKGRQDQPLHTGGQRVELTGHEFVMRSITCVVDQMGRGARQEEYEGCHRARHE